MFNKDTFYLHLYRLLLLRVWPSNTNWDSSGNVYINKTIIGANSSFKFRHKASNSGHSTSTYFIAPERKKGKVNCQRRDKYRGDKKGVGEID